MGLNSTPRKTRWLTQLRQEHEGWNALLTGIDSRRQTTPGAAGPWSVKDVVVHIAAYEDWLVDWLSAARRGTFPAPSLPDGADVDQRNARVFEPA